jgi:Glu-tRNA(Gln) amidotransferase subunit E-like FAD-binding protein
MNYAELGFKAGLEIHQQLEGLKLFCNCPALNSDEIADLKAERMLRAVVGESGVVDKAASHESGRGRRFIYVSSSKDTCSVDYDEEPPRGVNLHHFHTALIVCRLLNADIVDEVQVMRKIVVDGSNVSGFQRTMLVGRNGWVDTASGRVGIPAVFLEEEAAQKLEEKDGCVVYRLDRLGMALLEISTDASLKDAEHVKEVASFIGMILRSTERVKRGIGTIRQDVNISIKGGARTEIKGFQDLKSIPKVIQKEIERQLESIKKGERVEEAVRKANPDFTTAYMRPMPGGDRLYPETDVLPIRITKEMLNEIKIPELITEKTAKLEELFGISDVLARELVKEKIDLEKYAKKFASIKPEQIAHILVDIPKDIKTRLKLDSDKLNESGFNDVLDKLNKEEISKDAVTDILAMKCKGEKIDYSKFRKAGAGEIEKEIEQIVKEKPGLNISAYMGLVMAKLKGKVDGKTVMDILKKVVK